MVPLMMVHMVLVKVSMGVAGEDGYVGIFAGFEAAYSVVDAADAGGVAGDGAEAFFHGEAGFNGQAGAEGGGIG